MKEYPEPNYFLRISYEDPPIDDFLSGVFLIRVNHRIHVALVPRLPQLPARYIEADAVVSAEDAARYVVATNTIIVSPCEGTETVVETSVDREYTDRVRTIFKMPAVRYQTLSQDVERLILLPDPRLDGLANGPLARFLREDLPRANLSPNDRELLCLHPIEMPGSAEGR